MILLQKALMTWVLCCALGMAPAEEVAENSEPGEVCHAYALEENSSSPHVDFPLQKNFSVRFYTAEINTISDVRLVFISGQGNRRNLTIEQDNLVHNGTECQCHGKELILKRDSVNLNVSCLPGGTPCIVPGLQLSEDAKLKIENFSRLTHVVVFDCSEDDCVTFTSKSMTSSSGEFTRVSASAISESSSALLELCWRNTSSRNKCAVGHLQDHELTLEDNQEVQLEVKKNESGDWSLVRNGKLLGERNNKQEEIYSYVKLDVKVKNSTGITWRYGNCTGSQNANQTMEEEEEEESGEKEEMGKKEEGSSSKGQPEERGKRDPWMILGVIMVALVLFFLVFKRLRMVLANCMTKRKGTGARSVDENQQVPFGSEVPNSPPCLGVAPLGEASSPTHDQASPGLQGPFPLFPPVQREPREKKEDEEELDHVYDYFDHAKLKEVMNPSTRCPSVLGATMVSSQPPSLSSRDSVNSVYNYRCLLEAEEEGKEEVEEVLRHGGDGAKHHLV